MPIRGSMLVVSSGIATISSASGSVAGWARAVAVRAKTSGNTSSQRIITPSCIPTLRPKSGRATRYRDRRACQRRSAPRPLYQTGDIVSMSDVTYRRLHEPDRQAIGLASRRDQDTAIFIASEAGGGLSAAPAPEGGIARHAALATDAS